MTITISTKFIENIKRWLAGLPWVWVIALLSTILACAATLYFFDKDLLIAYGDAESHLNIAKRVVHSLTPGFAQLGGIWLPLPHLLMIPFVYFDALWRTGLAGAIVSGAAFVVSSIYLFKLTKHVTGSTLASVVASVVFMINPNLLYLQATPMTELVLIAFFVLSTYYFVRFVGDTSKNTYLILAAFFGFCATWSRYDGWFLVAAEAGLLVLLFLPWSRVPRSWSEIKTGFSKERWEALQGKLVLYALPAFFGILLWLLWDFLILGDPLYFTHSEFSAKSQQQAWLARGELPGYGHPWLSFWYYFITAMSNVGVFVWAMALVGLAWYALRKEEKHRLIVLVILLVPFIFNVLTLYLGQSVIFIPHVTPVDFEWRLFNVRYGTMMVPAAAFAVGYLLWRSRAVSRLLIITLLIAQLGLYGVGYSKVVSYEDGTTGLSSAVAKLPDAQRWITEEYDGGLVLVDDFARTLSIVRTKIPMQDVIYVGNKPYWPESLREPEKYANWIIMQENDTLWNTLWAPPDMQGRLYKYFVRVYTSPQILIFKRNPDVPAGS